MSLSLKLESPTAAAGTQALELSPATTSQKLKSEVQLGLEPGTPPGMCFTVLLLFVPAFPQGTLETNYSFKLLILPSRGLESI